NNFNDVLWNGSDKIYSYSFARVLDCKPSFEKSKNLNGRKDPVVLKFASAIIELEDGSIHNIVYSVDFLNAEKPELSLDYHLCLNILAKEYEKEHNYVDLKNPLTNPGNSAEIKKDNPFLNIAFVRYGYAITVFNSQKLLPFEHVFLNASKSHDTENPATQSYFRMLYTASCSFSDTLKIHHYNFFDYTDFSNSNWNFSDVQLGIIQSKKRYHIISQNDSKISEKVPLLNQDINLIKLFQSISAQLLHSDWKILFVVQHNYLEQYILEKHDTKIQISLHYNKKYEFTFGANKVLSGNENELHELMSLLETKYVIQNTFIKNAVSCFETYLNKYQIKLVDVIEHLYKAVVTISYLDDKAELELDIPSRISQKGIISNIKVRKVSSQAIIDYLKEISNM
ncbi:MAG: hypothetical protein K2I05_04160, partial [Mailhella sp.]|nr:hypothetical protein [Mailhella sp.]